MDLRGVAEELYGLAPGQFAKSRDSIVRQVRAEGDRALAEQIKQLKRPSIAAWVVNAVARHRPEDVIGLLRLGEQLREAQDQLAGDRLRELGAGRRRLIIALGEEAARLASELGHPPTEATRREVETTLDAALADPLAGEAVRSGLLVRSLQNVGATVDVSDATAIPITEAQPLPRQPRERAPRADPRLAARADVASAEDALREAEDALASARMGGEEASRREADLKLEVQRLQRELAAARDHAATAVADTRSRHEARDRAAKQVQEATHRLDLARARLDRLEAKP